LDEKTFKKMLNVQTDEIKRHQKMLLEEFQSRLKVVAEVQVDHTEKFKEISKKLDAIMEMTALNTENIETIKGMLKRKVDFEEFEKLEKRVSLLEKKLRMTNI
jgi:heptaprenylglyceryl phosphate synthase